MTEETNLPNIELVSEKVHEAWMITKAEQGFHAPAVCPSSNKKSYNESDWQGKERFEDAGLHPKTFKWCDKCHPCLYPYNELSEKDKDLDRSTVAAVYAAILAASPALGGRSIQPEGPSGASAEETGPGGETPNSLEINVEALEKEGWRKNPKCEPDHIVYTEGGVDVIFGPEYGGVWVAGYYIKFKGVSTMQQLLTLELLVNGPKK